MSAEKKTEAEKTHKVEVTRTEKYLRFCTTVDLQYSC